MYKKQTFKKIVPGFFVVAGLVAGLFSVALSMSAQAATSCGDVDTSIIDCPQTGGSGADATTNSGIWGILILVVNILSAGVSILAIGGIVYGAILYSTAGSEPDKVKKAQKTIGNTVVGLVAYGLMWSLLNFVTPGGLFN